MKFGISLPVRELGDDLDLIADFAREAEALGLTHLRVPEQVYRAGSGPLHEPMTMMTYIAAVTSKIELVPSVIILPACLLYTSPSPRDATLSRMPSSA